MNAAGRPDRLHVFHGEQRVGDVLDSSPLAFEYAASWLDSSAAFALAAIPLRPGAQDAPAVQAFFENLLPEGELRLYVAQQKQASTLFSLLLEVAGDTAGAFVLLPAGRQPEPPRYEATSWPALAAALSHRSAAAIDLGRDARISLAGAQDKASLALFDDGVPHLPRGTAPSTHILKPDIRRLAKVWHSAANEALVMRTAALCGLPTAEVFYEPHTRACVVRRFDRVRRADGSLARLVQYDLCQLTGVVSERKYEKEGGPGLADCATLIRRYSTRPALDLRQLVQWLFFNLFVGNNDSHAKNLSIQQHPDGHVGLTPCYDLMCTRLYPGLSPHFAFAIGGETRPGEIGRAQLVSLAQALGMQPRFLQQQATDLAQRLPDALDRAANELAPAFPPPAQDLAARLRRWVLFTQRKALARLTR